MTRLLLCFFLCGVAYPAIAQNDQVLDIEPGDPVVRGTAIQPYAARWRQWVTSPDGTKRAGINTIYDSVTVDVFSDTSGVIVRDVLWVDTTSGNTYRRVDAFDRASFDPIRMDVRTSPHSVTHVDFEERHVRGVSISDPLQPARRAEAHLGRGAFNWSSDGFVLVSLALSELAEFRLPVVSNMTALPSVRSMTFQVVGRERIDTIPFGMHEAVVVEHGGAGFFRGRYWISKRAPYVVRVEFIQPDETVTRWELF